MAKTDEVESIEDKITRALTAALEKALPAMAAAAVQTQISAQDVRQSAQISARSTGERCADCRQVLPAGVKQGEHAHIKVAIFPHDRRHGKWFQGLMINGVRYLSNNASHLVTVPADIDLQLIRNWEDNEDSLKEGREATHDSGSLGPSGSNVHQANHTSGWR